MTASLSPVYPSGFSTRDGQMFRFVVSEVAGVAFPTTADRVALSIGHLTGGVMMSLNMPADEARAMANALYEAADASEKAPPVAAATRTEPGLTLGDAVREARGGGAPIERKGYA